MIKGVQKLFEMVFGLKIIDFSVAKNFVELLKSSGLPRVLCFDSKKHS